MKPKLRRRLADLEARLSALESARPTVEVFTFDHIPDATPLDAVALWRSFSEDYAAGFDAGDDWRLPGYL